MAVSKDPSFLFDPFAEYGNESFHEYERTWLVNRDERINRLLAEIQPWMIVQGYLLDTTFGTEHSIRLIPAREIGVERFKTITYDGDREKISQTKDYQHSLARVLQEADQVAVKSRFLVWDADRAWLCDYFPDIDTLVVETEFPSKEDMDAWDQWPSWIGREVTGVPEGYTRNRARFRARERLESAIEDAAKHGSRAIYLPGETNFTWSEGSRRRRTA